MIGDGFERPGDGRYLPALAMALAALLLAGAWAAWGWT